MMYQEHIQSKIYIRATRIFASMLMHVWRNGKSLPFMENVIVEIVKIRSKNTWKSHLQRIKSCNGI